MLMSQTILASRFLSAADCAQNVLQGQIKAVTLETLKGSNGDETKPVVHFANSQKGLVLNRTNAATLQQALGDDTAQWTGRWIELYAEQTRIGSRPVQGIRVRVAAAAPVMAAPVAAPAAPAPVMAAPVTAPAAPAPVMTAPVAAPLAAAPAPVAVAPLAFDADPTQQIPGA